MELSSYTLIIAASIIIIVSFLFNSISKKTNIPSVLMLIVLGVILKAIMDYYGVRSINFFPALEVLGIVGLIMIVLEAALDLKLKKEKLPTIGKATAVALLGLVASVFAAAGIIWVLVPGMSWTQALLYGTPLSILSSAIMIPSVGNLIEEKKEFLIYESALSDILGIMLFYFLLGQADPAFEGNAIVSFFTSLGITIAVALMASYALILVFQRIESHAKLFLLIAILLLLYAVGKLYHLSPLIIILIFGLTISNMNLFFKGFLKKLLKVDEAKKIYDNLHMVTLETAFVVRTFFFVIFGITILLSELLSIEVIVTSIALLVSIYLIRFAFLRVFIGNNIKPQVYMAPRGLITVLLFYAIPAEYQVASFNSGILLFIIIATGVIMTWSLIQDSKNEKKEITEQPDNEFLFDKAVMPSMKHNNDDNDEGGL